MKDFSRFLQAFLPGIFLISYNVGVGSVAMMSKSGALYGCDLLWIVLLSSIIYYYLVTVFSKYTMVTKETFLYAVKTHISKKLSVFIVVSICLIIFPALMGLMGIMCDVLSEWSSTWNSGRISSATFGYLLVLVVCGILLLKSTETVKKLLSSIVVIIFFAFIANLFYTFPSIDVFFKGFIPTLPDDVEGSDNGSLLIVAGMAGTTISSISFIIRSSLVKEVGWNMSYYKQQKKDALLSAIGVFLISAAILVSATATLHVNKLVVNNAADLILLLKPIVGTASIAFMSIGILAAGITSHIPNIMVIPWVISDYRNERFDMNAKMNKIMLIALAIVGVLAPALGLKPVLIMILSQGLLAVLLPLVVGCIFYLMNSKAMKEYKNGVLQNMLLAFTFGVALFISFCGFVGIFSDLF